MVRNAPDAVGFLAVTHASMCREVGGTICDRASTLKASGLLSQQKIAIVMAFAAELRRSLKCATELRSELSSELPTMQPLPAQALPEQLPAGHDGLSTLHGLSGIPSLGASPRPEIYVDCVTGSGFQTFVCCIAALVAYNSLFGQHHPL